MVALVQCLKSDLIQESEPEALLLSPLTLAMPLTLILLIKPLPLTLESDVILDIGPGLEMVRPINLCGETKERTMSNSNLGQIEQWED